MNQTNKLDEPFNPEYSYKDQISNVAEEMGIGETPHCLDRIKELKKKHKEWCILTKKLVHCSTVPSCQRELLKKFITQELTFSDESPESDLEARTLFGLSSFDFDIDIAETDELPSWFSPVLSTMRNDMLLEDKSIEIPSIDAVEQFEILKLKIQYYKEALEYSQMLNEYETCLREAVQAYGEKTKAAKTLASVYDNALYSISQEAKLLNQRALKHFYSKHGGKASAAVKQLSADLKTQQSDLKHEIVSLQAKFDLYMQLKGTPYEDTLNDYRRTVNSVMDKKWVLKNLQAKPPDNW